VSVPYIAPDMLSRIMEPKREPLTKAQWDAALHAARCLTRGNIHNEADRAEYRAAKAELARLLPAHMSANQVIEKTVHWNALNDIGAAFAGPQEIIR
jgi:hypothetical protein